jgi:hypothetical protein
MNKKYPIDTPAGSGRATWPVLSSGLQLRDPQDVNSQVQREGLVEPPFAVVHVTGYEGFRVWVVEPGGTMHEQYVVSLVDMVRASWTVRKVR